MAATLTATPNPAGVWGESGSRTTTITWNTGSAQRGRVYLKVATGASVPLDETLFDGDPAIGARNGTKPLTVTFGSTYTLTLRQVSNNAVLATLVVTVFDVAADAGARGAATAALLQRINPSQAIFDLKIVPGIDTVRVSFRTSQPTIPIIQVTTTDGTELSSSFALASGPQTLHEAILGGPSPLPQATLLEVRIIAAGTDFRGHPRDARASAQFMTGTRRATIYFEQLKVTRDGDKGLKGDGDFIFTFGAGGVDDRSSLGRPWPPTLDGGIDEDDPPIALGREIEIERAPRNIWVQVNGFDNDSSLFNPGIGFGKDAIYEPDGTRFASIDVEDKATVTRHFDISIRNDGTIIPMTLATGDFPVAFTVTGHIFIRTTPGFLPVSKPFIGINTFARETALLANAGKIVRVLPPLHPGQEAPGRTLRGHLLARGADGAVYRKGPRSSESPQQGAEWSPAAPAADGPVIAVARSEERLALFALDREGVVHVADAAGDSQGAWRALGGKFTDRLAAVLRGDAIELFALDREGTVHRRRLAEKSGTKGSEWQQIGEGAAGELTAVPIGDDGCAVFVLDKRGEVLHQMLRHGERQGDGWKTIRGAKGVQLGAFAEGAHGVALALIDAEMALHTLQWADYPKHRPDWVSQGDLQDWLVGANQAPNAPAAGKMPTALSA